MNQTDTEVRATVDRRARLTAEVRRQLEELSGMDLSTYGASSSLLEIGFDSLYLTQASTLLRKKFGVKITLRQLMGDLSTLEALGAHVDQHLPVDKAPGLPSGAKAEAGVAAVPAVASVAVAVSEPVSVQGSVSSRGLSVPSLGAELAAVAGGSSVVERVMNQQLAIMREQLDVLRFRGRALAAPVLSGRKEEGSVMEARVALEAPSGGGVAAGGGEAGGSGSGSKSKSESGGGRFGPFKGIDRGPSGGLTDKQEKYLEELTRRYNERTGGSKRLAQEHRKHFCDPRAAGGFRQLWKEMVYPIVSVRSQGSRLWDIDGNEYVDVTLGFGANYLGHSPEYVVRAVEEQLAKGVEIGPQSELAGEVARMVCELTGMERATFCNTGSEAVMAAMRVARTVTGKDKVVYFGGDYHGIFDEVLGRASGQAGVVAAAPGIPAGSLGNIIVLEYGNMKCLEEIKRRSGEIAAVLVEPVQARHPDLQPREFLKQLRVVTQEGEMALIFDEVITGFRVCPGGAQEYFGVQADLATYGKVVGGGMPIGVLAGKAKYMDGLDGGMWSYGDESFPEVGVTFFAGTFVRHPLAMAAAKAVLKHLKEQGPGLQERVNERASGMVERINGMLRSKAVPMRLMGFSCQFCIDIHPEVTHAGLLFYLLRHKGVHIWEGRIGYISTVHTEQDVDWVVRAFQESVEELQAGGFLPTAPELGPSQEAGSQAKNGRGLPLTEAQREIWSAAQMGGHVSAVFNESTTVHLRGRLEVGAMKAALQEVVNRHEALRSRFSAQGDVQEFAGSLDLEVEWEDVSGLAESQRAERIQELQRAGGRKVFDLVHGPLLEVKLVKVQETEHLLLFTVHHIACDGWSYDVVLSELSELYSARVRGIQPQLEPPMPFSEYARWEESQRGSSEVREAEDYWLAQYQGSIPALDLPLDHVRPPVQLFNGNREYLAFEEAFCKRLRTAAAQNGCTLYVLLFAAFNALLYRLSGRSDIAIGIPAAGQNLVGREDLVGHCANLLPVRSRFEGRHPFNDFLKVAKQVILDAYDHQNFTFGKLVEKLRVPRDPSRTPVVSVMFNLDPKLSQLRFDGLSAMVKINPRSHFNFDIWFNLVEDGAGLRAECDYCSDLFEPSTILRWLRHYRTLLEGIIARPGTPIDDLVLLSEQDTRLLVREWNATAQPYPQEVCLHDLVEAQVERTPDAVAVIHEEEELTYRQLKQRTDSLALRLIELGVGPESLVGLYVERGLDMVVGMLGVLKAGGAYVPMDPAYPAERLGFMMEDAQMSVVLTQESLVGILPPSRAIPVSLDLSTLDRPGGSKLEVPDRALPDDLAYVIFTSGSTGRPKGVQICHRAVVNFLASMQRQPGLSPTDVLMAVTTLSFDIAGLEIFLPLTTGARLVLASRDVATDTRALSQELDRREATMLQATPATWRMLCESGWRGARDLVMLCGGEALPLELLKQLQGLGKTLWNLYGPTETTIWSTMGKMDPGCDLVTIGRPIGNTQVYIVDHRWNLAPLGVAGQLLIGGVGLARGYLNRADLTAEKFVPDQFGQAPGQRVYQTGDLARYRSDGQIECLGRMDQQVKIRGFRIELGEVESVLASCPEVKQAVVVARQLGSAEQMLVAYMTSRQSPPPPAAELRAAVKRSLPEYMVPSAFVFLESFPLTPNGKVDKKALPAPEEQRLEPSVGFVAPRDSLELQLVKLWEKMFSKEPIGIHENFFELGGTSMMAVRLFTQVEKFTAKNLPLATLFQAPTIEQLASILRQKGWEPRWSSLIPIRPGGSKPPFYCIHGVGGNILEYMDLAKYMDPDQPFYGIQARGLNGQQAQVEGVEVIAGYYIDEIRGLQPRGPYYLGGASFGGLVAYEMAQQLAMQGETVAVLAMFDTNGPGYPKLLPGTSAFQYRVFSARQRAQLHWNNLVMSGKGERWNYFKLKLGIVLRRIPRRLHGRFRLMREHIQLLFLPAALRQVRRAGEAAMQSYAPKPYPGKITLFRATDQPHGIEEDRFLGWGSLALGGVEVHDTPGHHGAIVFDPRARVLAEQLRETLETARQAAVSRRAGGAGSAANSENNPPAAWATKDLVSSA